MQHEKKNENEIIENRTTETTEVFQNEINPIHTNCKVCSSGFVDVIHKLRSEHTLDEISEILKNKHGVDLSKSVLSYHFKRYARDLETASSRKLFEQFRTDIDHVADHQRKCLFLANVSFDHIMQRLEAGTLLLGIDDFEKLVKLYHSVLKNPQGASDNNVLAIFQKASEKFGCTLEQGVLVKLPNSQATSQ